MEEKGKREMKSVAYDSVAAGRQPSFHERDNISVHTIKEPWWAAVKKRGSAPQIIIAALLALAIGLPVALTVNNIPKEVSPLLGIVGVLWLRALKAVVLPLIICSMILAVQKLREVSNGGSKLAKWTIGFYVLTTVVAIVLSCIMVAVVWGPMFTVASEQDREMDPKEKYPGSEGNPIHLVVVQMFESLIPDNVAKALVQNELLAVLVTSIVVGYLIDPDDSAIYRAVVEVEKIVTRIITTVIEWAPVGVFSLILSSILKLNLAETGINLGILVAGTLSTMAIHLFVVLPIIVFSLTKINPYMYWIRNSSAWVTAWGSASSAATLSVTLKCARDRGISNTVSQFAIPLGCLVNMDGTAIYFPMVVVFLARTQGMTLQAVDYVIIVFTATLTSIGATPIPSASLALAVMIAGMVNVPVTGMFGVVITIDWLLDRFRTALNVSGDLYGAMVVYKQTGIEDDDGDVIEITDRPRHDSQV